jgi:hypothetical protein
MPALNQKDAIHYIATRQEFTASALKGVNVNERGLLGGFGRLNADDFAQFKQVETGVDYLVMSYDTPIAWHSTEGWYVVSQKFSVTTSKHQNYTRRAIADSLAGVN